MPSTEYFGISDLSNTLVSFAGAFAILGMYDAMYRMFFDKEEDTFKKEVCSTSLSITMTSSIIVAFLLIVFQRPLSVFFFRDVKYSYLIILAAISTLVSGTNAIISAPTRMQNKRRIFLITNTVGSILSYSISIPLLLKGYYIIAIPLASMISGAVLELSFYLLNRQWFHIRLIRKDLVKPLLKIALPIVPSFLIYWIFNSSDRLMITIILNVGAEGVYSVGSKLGHTSQLIYTAFAGGWQYFAFSTMHEKDQVKSNSLVFEYLGIISFVATAFVCTFSYTIYKLLFEGEYVAGFIISPYLFLAPLLQMLFQVIGNQFLVVKNTLPSMLILLSGSVLNVILNLVLIPRIGIEGAAIATLIGYVASDIICVIVLKRMKLVTISVRFIMAAIFMTVYIICWRHLFNQKLIIGVLAAVIYTVVILLIYRNECRMVLEKIKKHRKGNDYASN